MLPPALRRKGTCQGLLLHLTFHSENVDTAVIKSTELDPVWVQNPGLASVSCVTFSRLLDLSVPWFPVHEVRTLLHGVAGRIEGVN